MDRVIDDEPIQIFEHAANFRMRFLKLSHGPIDPLESRPAQDPRCLPERAQLIKLFRCHRHKFRHILPLILMPSTPVADFDRHQHAVVNDKCECVRPEKHCVFAVFPHALAVPFREILDP